MREEREAYIQAVCDLDGDVEGRRAARRAISDSDIKVHGEDVLFSYVPYLFNEEDVAMLSKAAETTHGILCKVIEHYVDDPSYREVFGFSPELERLITLPCNYEQKLPVGRFDLFLSEKDGSYKFCEFNTDGSGAMSRDNAIADVLAETAAFERFAQGRTVEKFELFDSWVEAFMETYRSDANAVEAPTVAIADFEESGVFSDFDRFIAAFERAGVPARFVDVRAFEFDGESLVDPSDGTRIDAVYRRAVTSEMLQHPGECDALIDAVAAEKVVLIGHFRTTVVHSKVVSIALFDERTRAFLTDEEAAFVDEHCPRTYRLRSDEPDLDVEALSSAAGKDAWIIKPEDDYGSSGVYAGVDYSATRWSYNVGNNLDNGYIAQEFVIPPKVKVIRTEVPDDPADVCKQQTWLSMPGIYVYNGKLAGFYCRLGRAGVISLEDGGMCSASFRVG